MWPNCLDQTSAYARVGAQGSVCLTAQGLLLPEVMEMPQPPLEVVPQSPQLPQPSWEVEQVVSDSEDDEIMQVALLRQRRVEPAEPVIPSCDAQEAYEEDMQLAVGEDPASRYCLNSSEAWEAWVDERYFQTDEPVQEDHEMVELAIGEDPARRSWLRGRDAWIDWAHEFYFETDEGEYLDVESKDWDAEFTDLEREQSEEEECGEVDEETANSEFSDQGEDFVEDPVQKPVDC